MTSCSERRRRQHLGLIDPGRPVVMVTSDEHGPAGALPERAARESGEGRLAAGGKGDSLRVEALVRTWATYHVAISIDVAGYDHHEIVELRNELRGAACCGIDVAGTTVVAHLDVPAPNVDVAVWGGLAIVRASHGRALVDEVMAGRADADGGPELVLLSQSLRRVGPASEAT